MKLSNLKRAAEIADYLPDLKQARSALSRNEADVIITMGETHTELPHILHPNLIAIINAEINRTEKEVGTL